MPRYCPVCNRQNRDTRREVVGGGGGAPPTLMARWERQGHITGSTDERLVVSVGPICSTIRCNVMGGSRVLQLLQRGRTDSFFVPLKRIGELKLVTHVVEFREEECKVSRLPGMRKP